MGPGRSGVPCVRVMCFSCWVFALPRAGLQIVSWQRRKDSVWFHRAVFFPSYSRINELEEVELLAACVLLMSPYSEAHSNATIPHRVKPPLLISSAVFFSSVTAPRASLMWKQSAALALSVFPFFLKLFSGPAFTSSHILRHWLSKTDDPSMAWVFVCEWEGRRSNLLLLIPTNEHNLEARLGYPLTFVGWEAVGRSEQAKEEGNAVP